jgi:hypothetical protein
MRGPAISERREGRGRAGPPGLTGPREKQGRWTALNGPSGKEKERNACFASWARKRKGSAGWVRIGRKRG